MITSHEQVNGACNIAVLSMRARNISATSVGRQYFAVVSACTSKLITEFADADRSETKFPFLENNGGQGHFVITLVGAHRLATFFVCAGGCLVNNNINNCRTSCCVLSFIEPTAWWTSHTLRSAVTRLLGTVRYFSTSKESRTTAAWNQEMGASVILKVDPVLLTGRLLKKDINNFWSCCHLFISGTPSSSSCVLSPVFIPYSMPWPMLTVTF